MKTKLLILSAVLLMSIVSYAVTEQWSSDYHDYINQIRSDHKGGCSMIAGDGPYTNTVIWYDKKGNEKYRKTIIASLSIAACTKKYMAYTVLIKDGTNAYLIQVDKKGNESKIEESDISIGVPGKHTKVLEDKKGYFVVKRNYNTKKSKMTRLSYK